MDWSSGVYNKPVAIIVALDPSICHHNKHQRTGSCDVLEKNSFSCCVYERDAERNWIKIKEIEVPNTVHCERNTQMVLMIIVCNGINQQGVAT